MKHYLLMEFLKTLQRRPDLKKKLKVFAIVGVIGFFLLGAVTLYVGWVGVKYVAQVATQVQPLEQMGNLQSEVEKLPGVEIAGCWGAAQEVLSLESLLNRSLAEKFQTLKTGCWNPLLQAPVQGSESELI